MRLPHHHVLLGLILASSMGCSETSGPGATVGAVVITSTLTAPLLVGDSLQLAATALNETGGTISNAAFTWKSSDPTLASVSTGGQVKALGAGLVVISAMSGGKEGKTTLDLRGGGTLSSAGGVLTLLNGAFTISVPPGALAQNTSILIRPPVGAPPHVRIVPGAAFEIAPENMNLYGTLTLGYDPARLPGGVTETSLQLYFLYQGTWVLISGSTVDIAANKVVGTIYRTGTYAVAGTAVERIQLGGPLVAGALYVGQVAQFGVALFDTAGNPLTGRSVTWETSDATRATVDGGTVTAVAIGTATITALSEGKSASTQVSILTRPVPDWTDATVEWTTFQGNPSHTGYIAATVDPVIFAERWVKTLGTSALTPVTAGPGAVFVSTNAYFGSQRSFALDLASGTELWSKDFGSIHGVHPPAYANNTVYLTTSGHQDSFLWAFDAGTGEQRFKAPYGNQWSRYYAPVIVGGRVYMAGGGYGGMYAFDATDGTQRWFRGTNQYDEWTPAVRDGLVYAYTGSYSPMVIVADTAAGDSVFAIADPQFNWGGWSMNTAPVLGNTADLLAVQAERLLSFDLDTRAIRWTRTGSFTGAVTVGPGTIYVINSGALEARNESDGALLWSWSPPQGALQATTILTKNVVFAATATQTFGIDLGVHKSVWGYPAGGHLALSPQGVLLVSRPDGKLTAITVR